MIKENQSELVSLLGVGIGPFNLSLAALLTPVKHFKSYFFDQNNSFKWHQGMLFNDAEIQVSYLKDLVTLVDPTNPYSFIAYLSKHKRLYRFMNAQFKQVLRKEFDNYFNWVSRSIPNLHFNEKVEEIQFEKKSFMMRTSHRKIRSQHLVLGNGLAAKIPNCAKKYLGPKVFHNKDFLSHARNWQNKSVAVIGGGQSGAEIVKYIISQTSQLPSKLIWVTKSNQFSSMDDSSFANDLFTPAYHENYFDLSKEYKATLMHEQYLASNGISLDLLGTICQQLYSLEFLENKGKFFKLITNHHLSHMIEKEGSYQLTLSEHQGINKQTIAADIIILCTGYQWEYPAYLCSLADKIPLGNNQFIVNQDYSIQWDGHQQNRIYVQNAARYSHGVVDSNFCLMAWRSAKIINSLSEEIIYDLENESSIYDLEKNVALAPMERSYA